MNSATIRHGMMNGLPEQLVSAFVMSTAYASGGWIVKQSSYEVGGVKWQAAGLRA